jgi:hypothetical protein
MKNDELLEIEKLLYPSINPLKQRKNKRAKKRAR